MEADLRHLFVADLPVFRVLALVDLGTDAQGSTERGVSRWLTSGRTSWGPGPDGLATRPATDGKGDILLFACQRGDLRPDFLTPGPGGLPRNWLHGVNQPQTEEDLAALRRSVVRGRPLGEAGCVRRAARRLGLESTLRPRARPPKSLKK